ncbi:MAG: class III cytochrome C family protein [Nitrospirae bacterium]|nr:MAG: class III cytochrome C family protein [Nitrospirota bacterium]
MAPVIWRAVFYWVLATVALSVGIALILAIQKSGSVSVPDWPNAVRPGDLSPKHAFLSNQCETCHTPYRGIEASSCILCHAGDATLLARQSTAFHATIQSCSNCHIEHQAGVRPIRMDHDALIAIGRKSQLADSRSAAPREESLDCFACHSNRSPHRDLFGKQCAECHATSSWKIAGYQHPSAASTDCVQCHQAPPSHYMGHFHMISKRVALQEHARVEQCHLCHQTDSWNAIRGVGWYKHH